MLNSKIQVDPFNAKIWSVINFERVVIGKCNQ